MRDIILTLRDYDVETGGVAGRAADEIERTRNQFRCASERADEWERVAARHSEEIGRLLEKLAEAEKDYASANLGREDYRRRANAAEERVAELEADTDRSVALFNAGWDACRDGKPHTDEPNDDEKNDWLIGFAWCYWNGRHKIEKRIAELEEGIGEMLQAFDGTDVALQARTMDALRDILVHRRKDS